MELVSKRYTELQHNQSKFPCIVANLGFSKLCIHINIEEGPRKALIYDFSNINKQKRKNKNKDNNERSEEFFGFVNFS